MAEQQSNTASDSSRLIVDDAFEVAPVNDRLWLVCGTFGTLCI